MSPEPQRDAQSDPTPSDPTPDAAAVGRDRLPFEPAKSRKKPEKKAPATPVKPEKQPDSKKSESKKASKGGGGDRPVKTPQPAWQFLRRSVGEWCGEWLYFAAFHLRWGFQPFLSATSS